jgi:hypothetical protein
MASGEAASKAPRSKRLEVPETVDVRLSTTDAIAVGQTIRTLTRTHKVPPGVAEILNRVGSQMLAAALVVLP